MGIAKVLIKPAGGFSGTLKVSLSDSSGKPLGEPY